MNDQHFSRRSPEERRAMHSQMRDADNCEAFAANDNPRPFDAAVAAGWSRWADSRAGDVAFAPVVGAARRMVAEWRQSNRPRAV